MSAIDSLDLTIPAREERERERQERNLWDVFYQKYASLLTPKLWYHVLDPTTERAVVDPDGREWIFRDPELKRRDYLTSYSVPLTTLPAYSLTDAEICGKLLGMNTYTKKFRLTFIRSGGYNTWASAEGATDKEALENYLATYFSCMYRGSDVFVQPLSCEGVPVGPGRLLAVRVPKQPAYEVVVK